MATQITTYTYGDTNHPGDVTAVTDPDLNTTSYAYDAYGNRIETRDPLGYVTASVYNHDGWLTATYSPKANCTWGAAPPTGCSAFFETKYSYVVPGKTTTDEFGDVQTVSDPLVTTTYAYDANRNRTLVKDADTHPMFFTYDRANELTAVTRADKSTLKTSYYGDGTVHTQTDSNNNSTTYTYDSQARLKTVTDPLTYVTTYGYDPAGNQITKQDPGGSCSTVPKVHCTTRTYDADNELSAISYSDGTTPNVTSITYDHDGQRTAMTDGTGTSKWNYDSLHRLTSYTNGAGAVVSYDYLTPTNAYDLEDEVGHIVYPNAAGTVTQAWDADGRLASVKDWNAKTTSFQYDANSNPFIFTAPGTPVVTDTFGFNARPDQLKTVSTSNGATLFSALYTRDKNGQLASDSSVPSTVGSYKYTPLNQLCYAASSNTSSCLPPPSGATAYSYDKAGNLTNDNGTTQTFNKGNQLCWSVSGPSTNACTNPPTSGATKYTHNPEGDNTGVTPTTGSPTALVYNQAE